MDWLKDFGLLKVLQQLVGVTEVVYIVTHYCLHIVERIKASCGILKNCLERTLITTVMSTVRDAKDSLNMDDLASVATVNVTKALPLFKSTTPSIGQIAFDISRTEKMDAPTWSQKMKRWVGVKDIEITTTTAHDVQNISSVPRHMVISSESEVEDQPLRWKVRTKLKKKLLKRKISNDVLKENGEKKRPRMMSSGNLSSGSVQSNPPMQMQQTRQSKKDRPLLI